MRGLRWVLGVLLAGMVAVWVTYGTVPDHTTEATHFDVIVVLGFPAEVDGNPSLVMRARVLEAVREFKAGKAGHLILSGGAAHNQFVEGAVMAQVAEAAGVPAEDVIVEGQAQNTIQNVFYSERIMAAHGWTTAEVVSSANHLPRAGVILGRWRFGWREHAAPWPVEFGVGKIAGLYGYEMLATAKVRWLGFGRTEFLP